jgi:endonuclease III
LAPPAAAPSPPPLAEVVSRLAAYYGPPPGPPSTDPFELVLWESVAYLADDARRRAAFERLRREVGLTPEEVLDAPEEVLAEITRAGGAIAYQARARRLEKAADRVVSRWGGDLRRVLALPFEEARRELARFPAIGEPGAEKILLFTGTRPVLALDSNGLRVLVRLGYAREEKSYAATYRAVRAAVEAQVPADVDPVIAAHQLLRRHGQELCRRTRPRCEVCPVGDRCAYHLADG